MMPWLFSLHSVIIVSFSSFIEYTDYEECNPEVEECPEECITEEGCNEYDTCDPTPDCYCGGCCGHDLICDTDEKKK